MLLLLKYHILGIYMRWYPYYYDMYKGIIETVSYRRYGMIDIYYAQSSFRERWEREVNPGWSIDKISLVDYSAIFLSEFEKRGWIEIVKDVRFSCMVMRLKLEV